MFKSVEDGRRMTMTDARALLYYELTLQAFGYGELKHIFDHPQAELDILSFKKKHI